jgi:hypothetical protein
MLGNEFKTMEDSVVLVNETLGKLLAIEGNSDYILKIPDYQRTYCWEEKQVSRLLEDIQNYADKIYHMGSIILHKKIDEKENVYYDVVDGQQRLVTLSLLLLHLSENDFPFLNEKFESEDAQRYIAYNKWIIDNFIIGQNQIFNKDKLLNNLQFSVLILESNKLDLAYTFFTSENGRGKSLTDFDLLKSHHLRYVLIPQQAEHLAGRWDNLILTSDNDDNTRALGRTFEVYLFRLRKWMRKRNWDDSKKRKVKVEFEAAKIIPEIPPFGEQFHFYETIQGGTHFFAYAEQFIHRFQEFSQTESYKELNKHLNWEKHWWYRDCIEALLFAYYLKFGTLYLNEACLLICRHISQHRYETSRAYIQSVLAYTGDSEIVMMLDQSTSPTFFLAEMQVVIKKMPVIPSDLDGTRKRYNNAVENIDKMLNSNSILTSYFDKSNG